MSRWKSAVKPRLHHISLSVNRLKCWMHSHERAFAEIWAADNDRNPSMPPILETLIPDCTQEQATAVATVIQWLGSNVGQNFLARVEDKHTAMEGRRAPTPK